MLRGDRKAPADSKGLGGNSDSRRGLLPLVLAAIDQPDDEVDRCLVKAGELHYLLCRVHITREPVDQRLRYVGDHRQPADHVAVERAVAHTEFYTVALHDAYRVLH